MGASARSAQVRALREHRGQRFLHLLSAIVQRDLRVRYKETLLGFVWALFLPLAQIGVFVMVFSRVVVVETAAPYALYVALGIVPWGFFAAALQTGTVSLTGNIALVTKASLPRAVFPTAAVVVAFVDFAIAVLLVGVLMISYGIGLTSAALVVPLVLAIQVAFTLGLALLLAVGNLHFRDVRYVFGVVLTLWMFATSVVYPVERLGGSTGSLLRLNPMTPIINAYRSLLLHGEIPPAGPLIWSAAVALLTLWAGWHVFVRAERSFAEII